jgi:hypothetical protein
MERSPVVNQYQYVMGDIRERATGWSQRSDYIGGMLLGGTRREADRGGGAMQSGNLDHLPRGGAQQLSYSEVRRSLQDARRITSGREQVARKVSMASDSSWRARAHWRSEALCTSIVGTDGGGVSGEEAEDLEVTELAVARKGR